MNFTNETSERTNMKKRLAGKNIVGTFVFVILTILLIIAVQH